MPWVLRVKEEFSAAHFLPEYRGKCEALHGHNYTVEVFVRADELGRDGLAVDFGDIRAELRKVLPDHALLNDILEKPSAENLARHIYERLKPSLPGLFRVVVWEKSSQAAEFEDS